MPSVTMFLYCESTNKPSVPGEKFLIQNPYSVIRPQYIPSTFSFSIVFNILGIISKGKESIMRLTFKMKDSQDILIDTNDFSLGTSPDITSDLPEEVQGITGNMEFLNVDFKKEGYYVTTIYIDGEEIGEFPIYVKGVN